MLLTPAQIKPKSFESRRNSLFFLPVVDTPHVYVRAWALGCFYSHISTRTFRRALTASLHGQLRGDKECPFSGVTKSGRVWRKVPESGARSVGGKACRLGFCSLCANETGWVGRVRGKGELLLAR